MALWDNRGDEVAMASTGLMDQGGRGREGEREGGREGGRGREGGGGRRYGEGGREGREGEKQTLTFIQ